MKKPTAKLRPTSRLPLVAGLALAGVAIATGAHLSCADDPHEEASSNPTPTPGAPVLAPPAIDGEPLASDAGADAPAPRPTACEAPSREVRLLVDARDSAALARCQPVRTGEERFAHRCGRHGAIPPLDLPRLDESVLAFGEPTLARMREIAELGRRMGRDPRAVGLIGDSMTLSSHFFRPFSSRADMPYELSGEVRAALATPVPGVSDATIIDHYRGHLVEWVDGFHVDSFRATRAAEVGAKASYALRGGDASPAKKLIDDLSPAVALVLFGGNDAAYRPAPPEELADSFEDSFVQLLDALERNGIVPVLSTLARHGHQPGVADCGEPVNSWRIAVATNAINLRVIEIACRRRLPLIDLRHAMDAVDNRGLGPDGVHPSAFAGGAGSLSREGLRCGYNVRNYVTLRMLKAVKEALFDPSPPP